MPKRAVFLDRDGTIIDDIGFVRRPDDVRLLPRAAEAIRKLNGAGRLVVVVTNQSGVARGLLTEKDVAATNKRMLNLLDNHGAHVDAIYYCPHLVEGTVTEYSIVCNCRKPRPGLILKAAEEHDVDLAGSVMIGDAVRDAQAGIAAGMTSILLSDGLGQSSRAPVGCKQAADLMAAVEEILSGSQSSEKRGEKTEMEMSPDGRPSIPPHPDPLPPVGGRGESGEEPVEQKSLSDEPQTEKKKSRKGKRRPKRTVNSAHESASQTQPPETRKEETVSAKKKPIPISRASKEFIPEQEEPDQAESTDDEEPKATEEIPVAVCGRCGTEVPEIDFREGRAFEQDGVCICRHCVNALHQQDAHSQTAGNEDIIRELQNIHRALTYERFSYWHVFGAVTQAGVFAALIFTQVISRGGDPAGGLEGLLWVIFLQMLALTFFTIGRQ